MTTAAMLMALALCLPAMSAMSQDANQPPPPGERPQPPHRPGPPGGPGGEGHRPPPPLIHALDANHDGVIDAHEIANASAALLTLDKNGDSQLTMDELRPPRPGGPGGPRPEGEPGVAPQQDSQPPAAGERPARRVRRPQPQ